MNLQVVTCRSRSTHVTAKFLSGQRYAFSLCVDSESHLLIQTTFESFATGSTGAAADQYYECEIVVNPVLGNGAIISVDGVAVNADRPISPDNSGRGITGISWGAESEYGRSSANFHFVEFSLSENQCLAKLSTYEGCMDSRYTNFDPLAAVQADSTSCEDRDAPSLTASGIVHNITQFDPFLAPIMSSYDNVSGNITHQITQTGSVNASVVGVRQLTPFNRHLSTGTFQLAPFD